MAFLGQDGFVWAIGVVEDRFDPEKLGRVRVRWHGYHTEDKEKILTKDLPWAQVMQSVGNSAMAGVGDAPVSLVEGTWVVGFFRDPDSLQDPVVIGTMPGMNTTTALAANAQQPWGQNRGSYETFSQPQSYDDGNKTIEGSETNYKDFQFITESSMIIKDDDSAKYYNFQNKPEISSKGYGICEKLKWEVK